MTIAKSTKKIKEIRHMLDVMPYDKAICTADGEQMLHATGWCVWAGKNRLNEYVDADGETYLG